MAIISIEIDGQNLTPVAGKYTFTTQFLNNTSGELLNDARFPQNQIHITDQVTKPYYVPVEIADGNYSLANVRVRVTYKATVLDKALEGEVACSTPCVSTPIISVAPNNTTSYKVTLSAASTEKYNWRLLNTSNAEVTKGTVTMNNTNNFNITTPALVNGQYVLELVGASCRGNSIRAFSVTNATNNCPTGPNLESILSVVSDAIKFRFDALGVYGIAWKIKQGTSVLRNGVIVHTSVAQPGDVTFSDAEPTITFATLSPGDYILEIQGSTCTSTPSSKPFTVGTVVEPLAFKTGSPSASGVAGAFAISVEINKAGAYNTTILNSTTGVYYQQGNITYVVGTPYVKSGLPAGTYVVKVGTLEASLIIQPTGTNPCQLGPNLTEILSATEANLNFKFQGQNVTAIAWRIKKDGNVVRNSIVYPTNDRPFITFEQLAVGNYTFEIEGNNCTSAVTSKPFTIVAVPQGNNAGVLVSRVGNRYIGIINARDLKAKAVGTNIHLDYEEIRKSDNGQKDVKGYLVNAHMCLIPEAEKNALRSPEGLALPDGNYQFYLYYAASNVANSWDATILNSWVLWAAGSGQRDSNSRAMEQVSVEIKTNIP